MRIANEFLETANFDFTHNQWAECVQQGQLAVENAAKVALGFFGPVPRTHTLQNELEAVLQAQQHNLSTTLVDAIRTVILSCQRLGWREHILASYGDEAQRLTPSQLFGQAQAENALETATLAVENAQTVVEAFTDVDASETADEEE